MGCGVRFAKFVLIFFNVIFFLTGAALLAIGLTVRFYEDIWEKVEVFGDVDENDTNIEMGAYFLMAIGAFILITGFLGCCGAIKENGCMLGIYIFILVVVMLAEIAAGVLVLLYREDIEKEVTDELKERLTKEDGDFYYDETDSEWSGFAVSLNFFQNEFECCGIDSYTEYNGMDFVKNPDVNTTAAPTHVCPYTVDSMTYPPSCFEPNDSDDDASDLQCGDVNLDALYKQGCRDELKDFVDRWSLVFVAVALGFACLQIFGLIFAICLCRVGGKGE